ncbi:sulfite exporter TauE/SafE family protein [Bifidobacterium myosotis]|uniref:Probable membrane transporter protein n=1 Tax=Bifidobacterium myosotis TaxID=1630166 RepID=A0A5M9ZN10_9BIFI|nr:sulfite exporter TauE/SafE family protein [Bifidobacterium myosotis]KAA8829010.1 sulfite exporter TauE/SafE family protein [Bifidobacterium myosotis]
MITGFSIVSLFLILLAGIGAGFVGYAVGASSLVSYPALLAFGIPPVLANASNTVGVMGTGIGGVLGAQRELAGQSVRAVVYVSIGAIGGVIGAFLLLELDPSVFEYAAPALILFSSLVIAVNPRGRLEAKQAAARASAQLRGGRLSDRPSDLGHSSGSSQLSGPDHPSDPGQASVRSAGPGRSAGPVQSSDPSRSAGQALDQSLERPVQPLRQDAWWVWLGVSAVAVYSGYFGAGAGTCALAMLDAAKIGPFHKINALKMLIGTGANITASVVFIVRGAVDWPAAIMLCIGCFIGGYIAPPITRRVPARIMRAAAVLAGIVLAIDLALKTY